MTRIELNAEGQFKKAIRTAFLTGLAAALTSPAAMAQEAATADKDATELEALEVTGSRLGRADIEGALPVATITREEIDKSGFVSVGELLRNTTFNSLGAFRPQSGSSAQGLIAVDLRGLGSERTLVLIDGRRAPKAPYAPSSQDLNAVPLAMVERIEVLKDGASAIYGSDAIAGVINVITRKNYQGASFSYQQSSTERVGGDSDGLQAVIGMSGERGNIVFGVSTFNRDIIFARDSLYNSRGISSFSNNYWLDGAPGLTGVDEAEVNGLPDTDPTRPANDPDDGDGLDDNTFNPMYGALPGGCPNSDPAFFTFPNNRNPGNPPGGAGDGVTCSYDFNTVAADEAAIGNVGGFVRAQYKFTENWALDVTSSVTRATSFGRYAPSLNDFPIIVPASSPNNPFNDVNDGTPGNDQDVRIRHRFAALGTRDNNTDANVYDIGAMLSGSIGEVKMAAGIRDNEYQFYELGRNYVVLPIAEQYIVDGTYDLYDPTVNNLPSVLNAMKATITRDSIWDTREYFAEANMPIFDMAGGTSAVAFGVEYRDEFYFDRYDSLQEAGQIGGSAGNSAGTTRKVKSAYSELFLPILDSWEVSLSGRFEDYNDVGENFAPKLSTRYQPLDNMTLRGSVGTGFRAPSLDIISALPTYSAESINNDAATCASVGGAFTNGTCSQQVQVSTIFIANPELQAEESEQFSVGFAMDITDGVDFSIDYYNIALSDRINQVGPDEIVDRLASGDPIPPGLGVTRLGNGAIDVVTGGYANEGDLDTDGFDVAFNVNQTLGGLGRIRSNLLATYILSYEIDSGRDLVGDPAYPEYRITLANTWSIADFAVALNGNHIADQAQTVGAGGVKAGHIPSWTTWDVQVSYTLPFLAGSELALGALNVFGREPSNLSAFDGRDWNFYLYDQYGTQPYFKFTQKF